MENLQRFGSSHPLSVLDLLGNHAQRKRL